MKAVAVITFAVWVPFALSAAIRSSGALNTVRPSLLNDDAHI
jgi:hypothetical protein